MNQEAKLDPVMTRTKPWKVDSKNLLRRDWTEARFHLRSRVWERLEVALEVIMARYIGQPENKKEISRQLWDRMEVHTEVVMIEGVGFVFRLEANARERMFPR